MQACLFWRSLVVVFSSSEAKTLGKKSCDLESSTGKSTAEHAGKLREGSSAVDLWTKVEKFGGPMAWPLTSSSCGQTWRWECSSMKLFSIWSNKTWASRRSSSKLKQSPVLQCVLTLNYQRCACSQLRSSCDTISLICSLTDDGRSFATWRAFHIITNSGRRFVHQRGQRFCHHARTSRLPSNCFCVAVKRKHY